MADQFFRIDCKTFFDRPAVMNALKPKRRAALSKLGAFIRRRARTLTGRNTKKTAPPGKPPRRHVGQLHDLIQFGYDAARDSVVVGPEEFQAKQGDVFANNGGHTVPALLEKGGNEVLQQGKRGRKKRARYQGNPFMQPSLGEAMGNDKLKAAWSESQAEI